MRLQEPRRRRRRREDPVRLPDPRQVPRRCIADAPGCVTFNGDKALAYVRSRHYEYETDKGWQDDATSDYGRIARQQDFIRRALQKAIDKGGPNPAVAKRAHRRGAGPERRGRRRPHAQRPPAAGVDAAGLRPGPAPCHSYRVDGRGRDRGGASCHRAATLTDAGDAGDARGCFRGEARSPTSRRPGTTPRATTSRPPRPTTVHVGDRHRRPPPADGGRDSAGTTAAGTGPHERPRRPADRPAPNPLGIIPPDDPTCR